MTWKVSYDNIQHRSNVSANLTRLWAYFDNEDLWFELLHFYGPNGPEWPRELTKDQLSFHKAFLLLCDHRIVEPCPSLDENAETKGYSIHSCVAKTVLNSDWDDDLAKLALRCVASHVPDNTSFKSWPTLQRLTRHAARSFDAIVNGRTSDNGMERELSQLAHLYSSQFKLDEAESMYE